MIRYVLIAILTVAIVGLAIPAIEHGSAVNSERSVESDVSAIDQAASSLLENEELPPDDAYGAQRALTISLPDDSMTSRSLEHFEIERVNENHSVATYRVENRAEQQIHLDKPVVNVDNDTVEFGGTGDRDLVLTLEQQDTGTVVVVIRRL